MDAPRLRIEVVFALPDRAWHVPLDLPAGATVGEALAHADLDAKVPGWREATVALAIFSRPATSETVLHDGDRIELVRALRTDPKQARRERVGGKEKRRE